MDVRKEELDSGYFLKFEKCHVKFSVAVLATVSIFNRFCISFVI